MKTNLFVHKWHSVFYNQNYLIRKNLFTEIAENANYLNGKLLDFGCGNKPYKEIFKNVSEYVGIDFASDRVNGTELSTDIEYDGKNIPFNDEYFNAVLSTEVFEHVFNLEDTLKEINRVLAKDGLLFFTCPFSYPEHEAPYDFARYTSFGIKHLLEKNGFEILYYNKTGTFISVVIQYIALYIYYIINKLGILKFMVFPFLITPLFLLSDILHAILPAVFLRKDLYLNNVTLCRKK